VTTAKTKF